MNELYMNKKGEYKYSCATYTSARHSIHHLSLTCHRRVDCGKRQNVEIKRCTMLTRDRMNERCV